MALPPVTFAIMAGGKGERLWPLVRASMPKVCLSPDGKNSLIQQTIDRLAPLVRNPRWLLITTRGQQEPIRKALRRGQTADVLVEPQGKNTAACIALAAVASACRHPKAILVAVPADHWIGDVAAFRRAMRRAIAVAASHDSLVTIGIPPSAAHTGLGYIQTRGRLPLRGAPGVFRLKRFIEKPSAAAAARLVKQPAVFYNSGMFIGKAEVFLEHFAAWLPQPVEKLLPLAKFMRLRGGTARSRFKSRLAAAYGKLQSISFDYGVMQHLHDGLVVAGRFGWEDLGSWDAWARLGRSLSHTLAVDAQRVSVVGQPGHLVAAVGVSDLVVVQTPDATLICRPGQAQQVRSAVRTLAASPKLSAYL